jgi:hypothetical protein
MDVGTGSLAWSSVELATSVALADAVRRKFRTRVELGREGLWKRVIMSRVLCYLAGMLVWVFLLLEFVLGEGLHKDVQRGTFCAAFWFIALLVFAYCDGD